MSEEIVTEPVVTESTETVSQEAIVTAPENEASDTSQPVTSLDDAKKVLAKNASKPKTTAPAKTSSTGPTTDYEKQYKEIQKLVGTQSKELGELRKFHKENQPALDAYKQFLAQQQEQELLAKYQTDPAAVIKELARREAAQQIAPYQEQMVQAQVTQINSSLKEQLGSDYDTYAPVMAEMLDGFLEMDAANGSNYATELAQNPHVLMQLAAGKVALTQKVQSNQQAQLAAQTKAKNLQVAQGVGRSNTVQSAPQNNFKDLSLDDMNVQLRKMGIIK